MFQEKVCDVHSFKCNILSSLRVPQNGARTKKISRKGTTLLTKFMVIYSENGKAQPKRNDIFNFTGHCQNRARAIATKLYSSDAWVSNFSQQTEQMTRACRGRKLGN